MAPSKANKRSAPAHPASESEADPAVATPASKKARTRPTPAAHLSPSTRGTRAHPAPPASPTPVARRAAPASATRVAPAALARAAAARAAPTTPSAFAPDTEAEDTSGTKSRKTLHDAVAAEVDPSTMDQLITPRLRKYIEGSTVSCTASPALRARPH